MPRQYTNKGRASFVCRACGITFEILVSQLAPGCGQFCSDACRNSIEHRFWSRVKKSDDCWPWIGRLNSWGYGTLSRDGRDVGAHRISYELHFGPIPDGLLVCHRCDNPACVRPDHLFLGTNADNNVDAAVKGRLGCARLDPEKVRVIRDRHSNGTPAKALALEFGVGYQAIIKIVKRHNWKHVA